jgi:hypothetical protein
MFYVSEQLGRDVVPSFAGNALPPLETLGQEPIYGWVTGRHLLDRNITDETATLAGRLRLTLVKAEKKIPEALLRAECRMEELAEMESTGAESLPRAKRTEIKKEVTERLLPTMPPTLTAIPIVYDGNAGIIYAGATTDKQVDALVGNFERTTGVKLTPLTPETASLKRKGYSLKDMSPTSFSPECQDQDGGDSAGMDFLTWLWFFFEKRGGTLMWGQEPAGVMIEGPLTLFMEGEGAHVTVLRNGAPLIASEAKTAMLGGKKLKKAKVICTIGQESFVATVDADTFVMRAVKLPKPEAVDSVSQFESRMLSLARFRDLFLHLYDRFLDERIDPARWKETQQEIHQWLPERTGKA